jgi:hypothetical protein
MLVGSPQFHKRQMEPAENGGFVALGMPDAAVAAQRFTAVS